MTFQTYMFRCLCSDLVCRILLTVKQLEEIQKPSSRYLYIQYVTLWFQYMWKRGRFDKTICGKHVGISSQIPDPFLLNFSCPFDPPDTLSYWSTAQRSNPNTVNGNLGIILHAAQEMWKAGHSDWFSNNWEIWDKSRTVCVLITRVVGGITSHQPICALVIKKAIKHFFFLKNLFCGRVKLKSKAFYMTQVKLSSAAVLAYLCSGSLPNMQTDTTGDFWNWVWSTNTTVLLFPTSFLCTLFSLSSFFLHNFVPPLLSGQIIFPFSPLSDPLH